MIRKSLISLIFEAVSIQRWNDHIRPSFATSVKGVHGRILPKKTGVGLWNGMNRTFSCVFEVFSWSPENTSDSD